MKQTTDRTPWTTTAPTQRAAARRQLFTSNSREEIPNTLARTTARLSKRYGDQIAELHEVYVGAVPSVIRCAATISGLLRGRWLPLTGMQAVGLPRE